MWWLTQSGPPAAASSAVRIARKAVVKSTMRNFEVKGNEMIIGPSFGDDNKFYKNYLGLQGDPEGKRYIEYAHNWQCPAISTVP